ncbi:MAG: sulfoxide reductase heme-binding subunit YedZ [Proteobacteria bacterium]|nr:sulfoxide reductase heme-binding subunit YedZ [Pseudomonadota bacterium]
MNFLRKHTIQKNILIFNGAIPFVALCFDWLGGKLGANPPEAFIRTTGVIAIVFLVLSLTVTPLVRGRKWNWLMPHRRALGLGAFYYGCVHMLGYAVFDKSFGLAEIAVDIAKRPFILLGFTSFLLMVPLAATSNSASIRKLGIKRWNKLHKLTYIIAGCAAVHYWMIVKSAIFYPALFAAAIVGLLLWRVKCRKAPKQSREMTAT